MLKINQIILAQEVTFSESDAGRASKEILNIFLPNNPFSDAIESDSVPMALNSLWLIAMQGNMYKLVCGLGLFIAVIAVGFWCVKFYKTLEEGGLRPALNELVFPLLLIYFLSNNGKNMRELTMGTRDMVNGFNRAINTVIDQDVSFHSAIAVIANTDAARQQINQLASNCQTVVEIDKFASCLKRQEGLSNVIYRAATEKWPDGYGSEWHKRIRKWQEDLKNHSTNVFNSVNLDSIKKDSLDVAKISSFTSIDDLESFRAVILSFRGSFLYIIEVMMLVTGLIGPIFMALCLFPVGFKPLLTWGMSFLSLGFCKICFSLISGLSAVAMVYSGPENVDMLVAAIVLGLLAPVLSFSIASGSGLAALSQVSYVAQSAKINTGVGYYNALSAQGSDRE